MNQCKLSIQDQLTIPVLWPRPQDRLILGSNSTFLFIGYPTERGEEDWSRYDYDYFQSELAAAEGIHLHSQGEEWVRRGRG